MKGAVGILPLRPYPEADLAPGALTRVAVGASSSLQEASAFDIIKGFEGGSKDLSLETETGLYLQVFFSLVPSLVPSRLSTRNCQIHSDNNS